MESFAFADHDGYPLSLGKEISVPNSSDVASTVADTT